MTHTNKRPLLDARDNTLSDLEPAELVLGHMPKWLVSTRATPKIIEALNKAMEVSRTYHLKVGKQFGQLKDVETFGAALLSTELKRHFKGAPLTPNDHVVIAHERLVGISTLLGTLDYRVSYEEPKTVLWAALQNFPQSESFHKHCHFLLKGQSKKINGLELRHFASFCRQLDLGGRYQSYLKDFLKVAVPGGEAPTAEQAATHSDLELLKGYDLEVDAHVAYLSNRISETAYQALIDLVAQGCATDSDAQVMLDDQPILQSSLSILDTTIEGVIVFSADSVLMHPTNRLIAYIPNDPVSPLREYPSLQAFIDDLKVRLAQPDFQNFFSRFIALSAKPAFIQSLKSMPPALALTTTPLGKTAAHYLVASHIKKMFADAQVFAVPTRVVDEREREKTWQMYKSAGLFLVNVASLFVPALGAVMLAVAVVEMVSQVYEGVEDWAHGDIDHARSHLLNVAKDLAVGVATVVGVEVLKKTVTSVRQASLAYFNEFEPIARDDGSVRLWNRDLKHYESTQQMLPHETVDEQGIVTVGGKTYAEVDGKKYQIEFDDKINQWRIEHPKRENAYGPALVHNGEGTWQHAHEQPLEWKGSNTLMRRLGFVAAKLDDVALERVMQVTDTSEDVLREVHLDNLPLPALLRVSLKRFEIDSEITAFIEKMGRGEHRAPGLGELQLSVAPLLTGWPEGKGLSLLDTSGAVRQQYGNSAWSQTEESISVLPSVVGEGKLLETLLTGLTEQEREALIGTGAAVTSNSVSLLAQKMTAYAREHRSQVFESSYERFNVFVNTAGNSIQASFSGLPAPVIQALVETANYDDYISLIAGKVPLRVAGHARSYLQAARLDRALEGFYLESVNLQDTETLAGHFLSQLDHWSKGVGFEVRDGSIHGNVTHRFGAVDPASPRVLVSSAQGYQRYTLIEEAYRLDPEAATPSLVTAVFKSLTASERNTLGFPELTDEPLFNAALAKLAVQSRAQSMQALGMQQIKPLFKPPIRLASGKVGYPLCGRDVGAYSSSLQRRVRYIYKGFDDAEVVRYLDLLTEQGLDPLTELRRLKGVKREITKSLQAWIDSPTGSARPESAFTDSAENKYEASALMMLAWRRGLDHISWAPGDETYSVSLDGIRLGELPPLPSNLRLNHVGILKLSNMNFTRGINEFLACFPNITTLDMDNNSLVHIPTQLEQLPYLSIVSMARNRIELTTRNITILRSLTNLESLNLNYNPLGNGLDVTDMSYLRNIYLRKTEISVWPQGLITRPLLQVADLRDNQISNIPEEVLQLPARTSATTALAGNPLSEDSLRSLFQFSLAGGSNMGVRSEHLVNETAAFDFWTSGITNSELTRRLGLWSSLRADPASDDFFALITRLVTTADAQSIRYDLTRRVWEMIEAANENEPLRRELLQIAASPLTCGDSVAMSFSFLEQRMQLSNISQSSPAREAGLLSFAKRLFRLEEVGRVAAEDYNSRLHIVGPHPDELEVHLAYRLGLAKVLKLPSQPQNMLFKEIAGVTQEDLNRARTEVIRAEGTDALADFVSKRDFWREYLVDKNFTDYSSLTEPYFTRLAQVLRESPEMNSLRYLQKVTEIRNEMDTVIDAWSLEKTKEMLSLLISTPVSSESSD